MGVAQLAQQILEVVLVRVRVAVEAQVVYLGGGRRDGRGQGGAVGVLVGVEEDVLAIVFVVAVRGKG